MLADNVNNGILIGGEAGFSKETIKFANKTGIILYSLDDVINLAKNHL